MSNDQQEKQKELQALLRTVPEELLAEALAEQVNREPEKEIPKVVKAIAREYSGPLPPPYMLDEYEGVQSGLAERIVAMAENEQKHRHQLEETAITGELNKDKRGQQYALLISVLIIIGSFALVFLGHPWPGTVLGGTTLVSLAYIFITGKKPDNSDQQQS